MYELTQVERLPADQNPAKVYLTNLSESGRTTMRHALEVIAEWLVGAPDLDAVNWGKMRFQHVNALKTMLLEKPHPVTGEPFKPRTVNKYLCAIRGTLEAAYDLDQMTIHEYHKARKVKGIKVESLPAGRSLSPSEIQALLHVCTSDPSPAGARDGAMISLLYAAGLRRAETIALDLEDYNPEDGGLIIRAGKGRKDRIVYVLNGASQAMADWLSVRGDEPGALFVPIKKGGLIDPRRMTSQALYNMLRKRYKQANVKDFSPHDLRRTFITRMLELGNDLKVVSDLAGHKNVSTTARYDMRGEAAKRAAANRLHVPYGGREG